MVSDVKLRDRKVGIIVGPGFDDSQVVRVAEILRDMEASVELIGLGETLPAGVAGMRGALVKPNIQLSRVTAGGMDAVIIPGGNSTATLQSDGMVLTLLIEMQSAGKPIGAISNGVAVLTSAGIIAGMRVTADYRIKSILEESGATYLDQALVVDHNLVTSQSDKNLLHFVDAIAFLLEPATTLR